tara:strand:+ start:2715 stop:3002 length:288 start_codon:yes stop_codon:yes gene_type:complete
MSFYKPQDVDDMIVIRLSRGGRKKKPFYHVVVADSRSPRDGAFLEKLGHYNPIADQKADQVIHIDMERVSHWVSKGAQIRERVKQLIRKQARVAS